MSRMVKSFILLLGLKCIRKEALSDFSEGVTRILFTPRDLPFGRVRALGACTAGRRFRNGNPRTVGQCLNGFHKAVAVKLLEETNGVSTGLASKTIKELTVFVDRERWRPLVVERTKALVAVTSLLQRDVVTDDRDDTRTLANLSEQRVIKDCRHALVSSCLTIIPIRTARNGAVLEGKVNSCFG